MKIKSVDLPGIGKKYTMHSSDGLLFVIIIHHSGRREIYFMADADDDEPILTFELNDEEARNVGAILLGADYQPVSDERAELLVNTIRVEWIEVCTRSPLAHKSIKEAQIRKTTGVTVIGIKRKEEVIGSPDVHEVVLPGDVLMAIGKRDQIKSLKSLCKEQGS